MNREDRAKQFAPFDALKGLQEELRKREEKHARVEKKILSETREKELSALLCKVEKGSEAEITFFSGGHYFAATGTVTEISVPFAYLKIGDGKIFFDDIYDIKFL